MSEFRFKKLKVWRLSTEVAKKFLDLADELERQRMFRISDQLRGAAWSISNHIAEGSGSDSKQEFKQLLNSARRSVFELASMAHVLTERRVIAPDRCSRLTLELAKLSRMISAFRRTL